MKEDEDKILLEIYMLGFKYELDNKVELLNDTSLLLKAYNLGRLDALAGDEARSIDHQTNQQILDKIRN